MLNSPTLLASSGSIVSDHSDGWLRSPSAVHGSTHGKSPSQATTATATAFLSTSGPPKPVAVRPAARRLLPTATARLPAARISAARIPSTRLSAASATAGHAIPAAAARSLRGQQWRRERSPRRALRRPCRSFGLLLLPRLSVLSGAYEDSYGRGDRLVIQGEWSGFTLEKRKHCDGTFPRRDGQFRSYVSCLEIHQRHLEYSMLAMLADEIVQQSWDLTVASGAGRPSSESAPNHLPNPLRHLFPASNHS